MFEESFRALQQAICQLSLTDSNSFGFLCKLVRRLLSDEDGIVVVMESWHVDSTFRDAYYSQYSRRHFDTPRFSIRLSFFDYYLSKKEGDDDRPFEEVYTSISWVTAGVQDLQKNYLGSCVINPFVDRFIGRTFLRPDRTMVWPQFGQDGAPEAVREASIRLSKHQVTIAGKRLVVEAFPFHQQDGELMSCAEVTLLNLMKYYANRYNAYADVEPLDILGAERRNAHTRVIPTNGLDYNHVSSILYDYGLHPCLYDIGALRKADRSEGDAQRHLKRLMCTYIESGIPVAVNAAPPKDSYSGHSLICIGRGTPDSSLEDLALEEAVYVNEITTETNEATGNRTIQRVPCSCAIVDSADLYQDYVVIDDNQIPYSVRPFPSLSVYPTMRIARFIAPLHRGMTMEADNAWHQFETLLCDPSVGLIQWAGAYLASVVVNDKDRSLLTSDGSIEVVSRVFLASSKTFKAERVHRIHDAVQASVYACLPMPHFVWVCELYLRDEFFGRSQAKADDSSVEGSYAFAEIVMDATISQPTGELAGVILYNFPSIIATRRPDEMNEPLCIEYVDSSVNWNYRGIPAFEGNLSTIHGC